MNRENIDRGWSFVRKGVSPFFQMLTMGAEVVDLPHDFTISTDVLPDAQGKSGTGFYQGGVGCYTKYLDIPADFADKRILVEMDGAYRNAEVMLNGHLVVMHPHGYTPFHADLTPYIQPGEKNRLTVQVNNSAPYDGRWYTGSGLYRHVDLLTAPEVHLAPWSIFAHTDRIEQDESDMMSGKSTTAYVMAEVTVENHTAKPVVEKVTVAITREGEPDPAAEGTIAVAIPAMGSSVGRVPLIVANADLWDLNNPALYTVTANLENGDIDSTLFGIRTITTDAKYGLRLNGQTVKIKGGCVHADNGIVGAASYYDSEYRKMELHKRHGFNGIRCAHNPPSRDMLEVCDRLGLLVLDEAFDMWNMREGSLCNDYHLMFDAWWKTDLALMIKRDRNHPCVFMWSIGNEITERNGLSGGYTMAAEIADYARSLDPTRPITSAIPVMFNGLDDGDMEKMQQSWKEMASKGITVTSLQNLGNPFSDSIWGERTAPFVAPLDVVGYNYLDERYEKDGIEFPSRVICGLESYPRNIDIIWDKVERLPYVIGDFTWTSHDYIGEAGLGQASYMDEAEAKKLNAIQGAPVYYPWRMAFCSDFDLCGMDRMQLHYRKIVWGSDETYMVTHHPKNEGKAEVLGRWGWPEAYHEWTYEGYEGKPAKVEVFSRAEEVELFLNGRSVGCKPVGKSNRYKALFETIYEPGTLLAISYTNGVEVSREELYTTGVVTSVRVTPEKESIKADGQSLSYVAVELIDDEGRIVAFDDRRATAVVTGGATLIAFGNGRPVTDENYSTGSFTSYLGRYMAVLRAGTEVCDAELKVQVEGLPAITATIKIQ